MQSCKLEATPMDEKLNLRKGDTNSSANKPYRELIGCLMYAATTTRPDICASTNYFSRFQ